MPLTSLADYWPALELLSTAIEPFPVQAHLRIWVLGQGPLHFQYPAEAITAPLLCAGCLKMTMPTAFTVSMMAWSLLAFPKGHTTGGTTTAVENQLR